MNLMNPRKERNRKMKRTVITVVGKDKVGIMAQVCSYLANNSINILDISQTIVQGFFNMMMIVDASEAPKEFDKILEELEQLGTKIGVIIKAQHEDIFDKMHRI
jgi:ACT domain-containing protein